MESQQFTALPHEVPSQLIHDLRTPLNQIIGYSEMLIEQEQGNAKIIHDLAKIQAAGHNLLSQIDENFQAVQSPDKSATLYKDEVEDDADLEKPTATDLDSGSMTGFVLVVDDQEANRDVLSRMLQRKGYEVAMAENGKLALEMLVERKFDLVLLDIMMPVMDGYTVLQNIKNNEQLQHIPVIMISALGETESVVRCIEMGADDYLTKPFNRTLLKARIGACLDKKRGHDREKLLYEQLQENYKRLQELEKIRDDLTRMIIHDLRTPLTSVMAGMRSVGLVGDLNPDQHEMVNIAVDGGEVLLGTINDLLDIDKMESQAMQLDYALISADDLVSSSISQVALLTKDKRIDVITNTDPELPALFCDGNKLGRVIVNLLGNAIKFTPTGGKITVNTAYDGLTSEFVFSVIDTGEGIAPESFEKIFDKFGQVESRQGGRSMSTGLGLTFCKLAVEAHGGAISVESSIGLGSTFRFTIPLQKPETSHTPCAKDTRVA